MMDWFRKRRIELRTDCAEYDPVRDEDCVFVAVRLGRLRLAWEYRRDRVLGGPVIKGRMARCRKTLSTYVS